MQLPWRLLLLTAGTAFVFSFLGARAVSYLNPNALRPLIIALLLMVAAHRQWASRDLLLLTSVLLGTVKAFQMPAQQALTPQLVPPVLLQRAITLSASAMQAAIIGGPALGGVLYTLGPATVYAVSAGLLLLAYVGSRFVLEVLLQRA